MPRHPPPPDPGPDRRAFLEGAGAIVVPPTMVLLLSTFMGSPAIAASGGIGVSGASASLRAAQAAPLGLLAAAPAAPNALLADAAVTPVAYGPVTRQAAGGLLDDSSDPPPAGSAAEAAPAGLFRRIGATPAAARRRAIARAGERG
ncbi:MAG: hypothetical protein JWO72_1648 [Caulobacteraceae bacterium]|nr:hypothetical protein [Caulobacteraceae bacterium]